MLNVLTYFQDRSKIYGLAAEIADANARAFAAVARAIKLLDGPLDTFLGRKQDFVAMPDDPICSAYPAQPEAANYRAYILNDHGHIFTYAELKAQGDADATRQAQHLRDGFDVEVWQQSRRVAILRAPK